MQLILITITIMNLKDYYSKLADKEVNPKKTFREEVLKRCRITNKTFYNWVNNPDAIPVWALELIQDIQNEQNILSNISVS